LPAGDAGVRIVAASGDTEGRRCCGATASITAMGRSERWPYGERKRRCFAVLRRFIDVEVEFEEFEGRIPGAKCPP
jgi:hypothetical protein